MDGLMVVGVVISVVLAGGLTSFLLLLVVKRRRRHVQAVTAADLVAEARRHGEPIRLNWSLDDLDVYGRVRPSAHDDLPTGVFPAVQASNDRCRYNQ